MAENARQAQQLLQPLPTDFAASYFEEVGIPENANYDSVWNSICARLSRLCEEDAGCCR